MKININKRNIIQAFIVITAFICIFGYVFVNNTKILKAEDVTSTEVTIYCHEYAAYTNEYEIIETTHEEGEWTFYYKVKCICPTCGNEVWEEDREKSYSDADYSTEEEAIAELESDLENDVRSESNTECNNAIGPMNFYIAAFQKNLYGFSESTYFISIKLDTNGLFELEEGQGLRDKLYDLNIDITASSENGSWDNNYWWSSDVDANDPDNTMEYIAYLDCNDVYTFTLYNDNTGEELGSLIYSVDSILSPRDETLANLCTLTIDPNLPDGYTTSDFNDENNNYPDYAGTSFGDFLVEKSTDLVSFDDSKNNIYIEYIYDVDEYGRIIDEYGFFQNSYIDIPVFDDYLYLKDREYYLYGFNTEPDGSGDTIIFRDDEIDISSGTESTGDMDFEITENTTIYAMWHPYIYYFNYMECNPYDLTGYGESFPYDDYKIKYNGEYFNGDEYWQYEGIGGSYFNGFGLDDQLNLPELTLMGYTFTGWDIVDLEYYYTRDYEEHFIKFIGKSNTLRDVYSFTENQNGMRYTYVDNTHQYAGIVPHFEKSHDGNIKFNIYVKQGNNYVLYNDEMVFDYNNLNQTIDLPYTFETNGNTSEILTVNINNESFMDAIGDYDLFYEDCYGNNVINFGILQTYDDFLKNYIFYYDDSSENLIQVTDNNNNSLINLINFNRTNIVATPDEDQDMILNLYLDLPADTTTPYSIEYNLNDISDYYDVTINTCPTSAFCEESVTIPNPTLKGYTFIGWKVNDTTQIINRNDGTYTDLASAGETVTLTAQWQPWTVKMAFIVDIQPIESFKTNYDIYKRLYSYVLVKENSTSEYYINETCESTYDGVDCNNNGIKVKCFETIEVDVNKIITEDPNFSEKYNYILNNYIFPGYEMTGLYISSANPSFNNLYNGCYYLYNETCYSNNSLIDLEQPFILSLPDNYNPSAHTSDKPYYLSPYWEGKYKFKVNVHYDLMDCNGEFGNDPYDISTYCVMKDFQYRQYSDNINISTSRISTGSNNIITGRQSLAWTNPTNVNQYGKVWESSSQGPAPIAFVVSQNLYLTKEGDKYKLNDNFKNISFSNGYNNYLFYAYENSNTYWASFDVDDYEWLGNNYNSRLAVDTNRSTITYTPDDDTQDAIVELYLKAPRKQADFNLLFIADQAGGGIYPTYNNIKISGDVYYDRNGVTNYNNVPAYASYSNTGWSSGNYKTITNNGVSEQYDWGDLYLGTDRWSTGYYYKPLYYGSSFDISITMDGYHILMYEGDLTNKSQLTYQTTYHIDCINQSSYTLWVQPEAHISTPLNLNLDGINIDINNIIYDGSHINKLVIDDETIWEKTCDVCGQAM